MRRTPRHLFLPGVPPQQAYVDESIYTKTDAHGTSISAASQPRIVAMMLEQLDVRPGQRIMEAGAGTGYNAALLAAVVGDSGRAVTIDVDGDGGRSGPTRTSASPPAPCSLSATSTPQTDSERSRPSSTTPARRGRRANRIRVASLVRCDRACQPRRRGARGGLAWTRWSRRRTAVAAPHRPPVHLHPTVRPRPARLPTSPTAIAVTTAGAGARTGYCITGCGCLDADRRPRPVRARRPQRRDRQNSRRTPTGHPRRTTDYRWRPEHGPAPRGIPFRTTRRPQWTRRRSGVAPALRDGADSRPIGGGGPNNNRLRLASRASPAPRGLAVSASRRLVD